MVPSSRRISAGLPESGRWQNRSPPGSASSSGIHSRIACHGGSMGSNVSMSKGGSGGGGMSIIPSQSPWRAEEELDFAGAKEGVHDLHGGFTTRALERVRVPYAEDEVAPERAHGAGGDFGWRRDDGRFRYELFFAGGFREHGGWPRQAAALVRVDAVVADGLLASGRDVVDGSGQEVGGFEDFEISLRAPNAAGAVDDCLGLGVPVDLLKGERGAQQIFGEALAAFGVARRDGFLPSVNVKANTISLSPPFRYQSFTREDGLPA